MKKILFISHDATRTGAPIVFLHLLNWLQINSDFKIHVLLKNGGELYNGFSIFDKIYLWNNGKKKNKLKITKQIKKEKYDLIYANSVASSEVLLELIKHINVPIVMHVHELSISIKEFCGQDVFKKMCQHINTFVVASKAVSENLQSEYQISKENHVLVYEFINTDIQSKIKTTKIRRELNINDNSFIICGSGTTDWRKGPDLFVQTARDLYIMEPSASINFIWIGGQISSIEFDKLNYDIKKYNLTDKVSFIGAKTNPFDYYEIGNCFLLTSREDPYPLVCLENAALKKPILCFQDAGGMPEFVENDSGKIVPYGSTIEMAKVILDLYNNPNKNTQLGENAAHKIKERHNVEIAGKKIFKLIQKNLSGKTYL